MGSLSLFQGIFPTQGLNLGLLRCMWNSLPAEPQGKPKNTGGGSLSLLQEILFDSNPGIKLESPALQAIREAPSHSVVSDSLQPHELDSPWNSPGQNTGEGSPSLLQGIFPIQGLNPGLLHYMQILYQLSYQRSLLGLRKGQT